MVPVFLSSAEIEIFEDVSRTTAYRRLQEIKQHFGIAKYQKVSIVQYAKFRGMKVQFVMDTFEKKLRNLKKE